MVKFSIITVCKNAEKNIQRTMESVLNQTFLNIEYILCDSCSTDNTVGIIQKVSSDFGVKVKLYSEKDFGIYNGMNRGISRAEGDYIIFLNAGDEFYDCDVLRKVSLCIKEKKGIYYGITQLIDFMGNRRFIRDFEKEYPDFLAGLLQGSMPCHQSIIARKDCLRSHYFNEQYAYRADFDWLVNCYKQNISMEALGFIISKYDYTGITSQVKSKNHMKLETQKILERYYPFRYKLCCTMEKIKYIFE